MTKRLIQRGSPADVTSISEEIAGALGASIGRAIRSSVEAWKKTAAPDLARRVRLWRGDKVRESSSSLDDLAREFAALRREISGRREVPEDADPRAIADRIASAVAAHLGDRLAPTPPPPPASEPKESGRIPFDDISGIVDRLIRQQY